MKPGKKNMPTSPLTLLGQVVPGRGERAAGPARLCQVLVVPRES